MSERWIDLTLRYVPADREVGEVQTVLLDPEDERQAERLREIFIQLAAQAENEPVRQDRDAMPWLADYALDLRERGQERVLFTYREFGA